jgi:ABC-type antimicrobial peptide transport system permease subunit
MMEIGDGSSTAIQRSVASMGANNLMILPGAASSGGISWGVSSAMTLTPDDSDAILKCPAVLAGAPVVRVRAQVLYGNKNWSPLNIMGTTPAYLDVREWKIMDEGDPFTERDVRNSSKVCMIGKTLVRELFNGLSPIGKEIRVQNVTFTVVGVLSAKGANMMGMDQDDILLAPWTTIKFRVSGANGGASSSSGSSSTSTVNKINQVYPNSSLVLYPTPSDIQTADSPQLVKFANVDMITVAARSASDIKPAIDQITEELRERHRIREGQDEDFQVRDMTEMTNMMTQVTGKMTTLLLCVASISLLVGGVGIMNIMLVSVTERTREIGLRMAVGAQPNDILWQFLVEAMVLCLLGGLVGILAGHFGLELATYIMATRFNMNWPTQASPIVIFIAFVISGVVGLAFGLYPAWKASRLDPIEALRYE